MLIAMSQSSSSPGGASVFCGSPSAPAFFEETSGYPTQQSRLSPDEGIDLNKAPLMFSESPAMRRTAATNADVTASRGLLFGNAADILGQVRAIYLPDPRLFIVFPADCLLGALIANCLLLYVLIASGGRIQIVCCCVYLLRAAAGCKLFLFCVVGFGRRGDGWNHCQ